MDIKDILNKHKFPVVAFSGGKDSTTVLDLVRKINPNVKAVFCNTGVEHRETVEYCRSIDNLVELKPIKSFWKCVDEYGYPDLKSKAKSHGNRCCYYLKEKPMINWIKDNNVDLIFTGLTSSESRNRMMFFKRCGEYYFMKSWGVWKAHPIHNYTVDDVWNYIKSNNLDYNKIYDKKGVERCGCTYCSAYCHFETNMIREIGVERFGWYLKKRYNQRQLEVN